MCDFYTFPCRSVRCCSVCDRHVTPCWQEEVGQLRTCCVCGCVWSDERTLKVTAAAGRSEWSVKALVAERSSADKTNTLEPPLTTPFRQNVAKWSLLVALRHNCMICVWTFRDFQHKTYLAVKYANILKSLCVRYWGLFSDNACWMHLF